MAPVAWCVNTLPLKESFWSSAPSTSSNTCKRPPLHAPPFLRYSFIRHISEPVQWGMSREQMIRAGKQNVERRDLLICKNIKAHRSLGPSPAPRPRCSKKGPWVALSQQTVAQNLWTCSQQDRKSLQAGEGGRRQRASCPPETALEMFPRSPGVPGSVGRQARKARAAGPSSDAVLTTQQIV